VFRRVLTAVFLACSAAALLSCSRSTEPAPIYRITFEGVVTDFFTGEPMVGFGVQLAQGKAGGSWTDIVTVASTVTDNDGFYVLSRLLRCDPNSLISGPVPLEFGRWYVESFTAVYCTEDVQVTDLAVSKDPLPD